MKGQIIRAPERGNVLFLILIAVALFAALSYAVTQSSRSSGRDASEEKLAILASQVVQYATAVENAIMRMRINNGCSETDISFSHPSYGTNYNHTPVQPDKCRVLHPAGGGAVFQAEIPGFCNPTTGCGSWFLDFAGNNNVLNVGTSNADLIMWADGVEPNLCIAMNERLGISNPSGSPPSELVTLGSASRFKGTYTNTDVIGNDASELSGQRTGCFFFPVSGTHVFYHVLIAR